MGYWQKNAGRWLRISSKRKDRAEVRLLDLLHFFKFYVFAFVVVEDFLLLWSGRRGGGLCLICLRLGRSVVALWGALTETEDVAEDIADE